MKKLGILGSTGSIGKQALSIVRENKERFKVVALACKSNVETLLNQIDEFNPEVVCVFDEKAATILKEKKYNIEILTGYKGLCEIAKHSGYELLLNGLMGMIGLEPTYRAIETGKDIALANKETLVAGGNLIMNMAKEKKVDIIPVDSEHSAVFQCLQAAKGNPVKNIILTASGGPFLGKRKEELENVTLEDALKHPNWAMGKKITVDSSTLMNKGLEVIEARWLFDLEPERIKVIIHPESIIHSMIEFEDHAILAQLGEPDMKIPISLGMSWPLRLKNNMKSLDFDKISKLTFKAPDTETFPCLEYAYEALKMGDSATCILNSANEVLVEKFINKEIGFQDIPNILGDLMGKMDIKNKLDLDGILELDKETREKVRKW